MIHREGGSWRKLGGMRVLVILMVVVLIAIIVAMWRIKRPPPSPPIE
jgi:hypothetical protein